MYSDWLVLTDRCVVIGCLFSLVTSFSLRGEIKTSGRVTKHKPHEIIHSKKTSKSAFVGRLYFGSNVCISEPRILSHLNK